MPAERRILRELRSEVDLSEQVDYIAQSGVQAAIRFIDILRQRA